MLALFLSQTFETYSFNSINDLKDLRGLKIAHLNIRSCLPKIDILAYELSNQLLDVTCLSETWFKPEITDTMVQLNGMVLERLDRVHHANSKQGGGVCMYIKASNNYLPNKNLWTTNSDIELMCITLIPVNACRVHIINIYRPPKGNLERAIEYVRSVFEALDRDSDDFVILGDFNVDLMQNTSNAKLLRDKLSELGLTQVIK